MVGNTLLQILLFIQVFIIGVLATIAFRHAYAHFRPDKHEHEPKEPEHPVASVTIPASTKEQLLKDAQAGFETAAQHAAAQLQHDLNLSSEQVNGLVRRLATEIVAGELERYRAQLSQLHTQAEADMSGIRKEIADHEAELKAKLAAEMETEKQRLLKQIDTKLADAVGSFLTETLQHNIDLGAQSAYLVAMLEEHKADFKQEVADDTQPAG